MTGRLARVLAPAAAAIAVLAVPAAASAVTCANQELGPPGPGGNELLVDSKDRDATIGIEPLSDGRVRVYRSAEDEPERLIGCSGGQPTLTGVDAIVVRVPQRAFSAAVELNLEEGMPAPGATPEADGGSEIEIRVVQAGRKPSRRERRFTGQVGLHVMGGPGPESADARATGRGLSVNLAAGTLDGDYDVMLPPTTYSSIDMGEGNDSLFAASMVRRASVTLRGEGGADVLASTRGPVGLSGGEGNDLLSGGAGANSMSGDEGEDVLLGHGGRDYILGGSGLDRIGAGGGRDRIFTRGDGQPDQVECGGGRDRVAADMTDVLHGCERRFRLRPGIPPPPIP